MHSAEYPSVFFEQLTQCFVGLNLYLNVRPDPSLHNDPIF
jgi:hypothetical protein